MDEPDHVETVAVAAAANNDNTTSKEETSEEQKEKTLETDGEPHKEKDKEKETEHIVVEEEKGTKVDRITKDLIDIEKTVKQIQFSDEKYDLTPKDSLDPSYSNLVLPYRVICRQRYRKAGAAQRAEFIREIKKHALLQNNALDGVRIHRIFCNGIISKPKPEELIKLTREQERKIEAILRRPF